MNEKAESPDKGEQPKPDIPPPAQPHAQPVIDPQPVQRDREAQSKETPKRMSRTDKIMSGSTIVIAVFTVVLAVVSYLQWKEIRNGGIDTHNLADAAGNQATWTQRLAGSASTQAGETHDLAIAAGKQADAAKALADLTAKQVVANQELLESEEASISISFGRVLNPITFHDGAPSIVFSIVLQNTGAIKATHVVVRFKPYYSLWGNQIFTEPLEKQRDFCATPVPPEQEWAWQNGRRINLKGLRDSTATVDPRATLERELNFGMSKPTDAEILKWPPADTVQGDPTRPVTDRIYPIIVGCVDYQSGAMPEKHQTGFIFEVEEAYADPSAPNAAPTFIHYGTDAPRDSVVITPFYFGQGRKY